MARVNEDERIARRISRRIFEECYEDLVNKVDLDILYTDLKCQCEIKCLQLTKVYILRGGETPQTRTVFDYVAAVEDEELVKWLDAIQTSLSNTSNQKCSHGTIVDKMIQIRRKHLRSTMTTRNTGCSNRSKPEPVRKWMGASISTSQEAIIRHKALFSPFDVGRIERVFYQHSEAIDIKIITIGGSGTGKSCFLSCYHGKGFQTSPPTVGCQYYSTTYFFYNGQPIQVTFLDTAGQERFNSLPKGYYRDSGGAMIFVDLDQIYNDGCTLSIDRAKVFFNHLKEAKDNPICLLVGAKYDMVRNFTDKARKDIDDIARRVSGGNWIYTSAKENLNLEKAVNMMIELIMRENNPRCNNNVRVHLPCGNPEEQPNQSNWKCPC